MDNHPTAPQFKPQTPPPTNQQRPTNTPPTPHETRQELAQAIHGSNEVLTSATTAFKIFNDTLIVDRAKLTVTKRTFWRASEVMSIRMEDLLNVTATVGPIFGSVKIVSRVMNADKPYEITNFWRDDALRVKRITQGYVIALQQGIDCNSLPADELAHMLDKLGEDAHT